MYVSLQEDIMYFNYANPNPKGLLALSILLVVASMRYFFVFDLFGEYLYAPPVRSSPNISLGASLYVDAWDYFHRLVGKPIVPAGRPHLIDNYTTNNVAFCVHVASTGLAFVIAGLQMWASFRKANMTRHRWLGRLYMVCMLVGCVTSVPIALHIIPVEEMGGLVSCVGFLGMAGSVTLCNLMGWYYAWIGEYAEHKIWMVRAYGVIWGSFFWFRIALSLIGPHIPKSADATGLISNLSWVTGWIGADVALSLNRAPKTKTA